jgi:hypothetical protein
MKNLLVIFSFILGFSLMIAGDTQLEYFRANSDGKVITIEWKASNESTVSDYEIERAAPGKFFEKIHTEKAINSQNADYKYIDDEAYYKDTDNKTINSDDLYSYRIKIVYQDNSYTYSNTINVEHKVSSIRRTWGMIKQMFL